MKKHIKQTKVILDIYILVLIMYYCEILVIYIYFRDILTNCLDCSFYLKFPN